MDRQKVKTTRARWEMKKLVRKGWQIVSTEHSAWGRGTRWTLVKTEAK